MSARHLLLATALLTAACSAPTEDPDDAPLTCSEINQDTIFHDRLVPLLNAQRPSSCSRCHLPGVDLSRFVQGDPCQTIACLVEDDLVDLDDPVSSRLLAWIDRGQARDQPPEVAQLAAQEYEAVHTWLTFNASCHEELCGESRCDRDAAGEPIDFTPDRPLTREAYGCEPDALARAFADYPWRWHGRCYHCHAPSYAALQPLDTPAWMSDDRTHAGGVETGLGLLSSDLIDTERYRASAIITKPLTPYLEGVEHGGGPKILDFEDELYVDLRDWTRLVAECAQVERE